MPLHDEFLGEYVKVVYEDQGREQVVYGTFEGEDELMIKLRFNTGIPTMISRRRIVRITLAKDKEVT